MSYRPVKILLRLWMKDIYKLSKGYDVGLDVAKFKRNMECQQN